ncbi:helicase [Flavobacterium psychrophilum]|uniref:DEAD/DEAH box helicase n=1 Tax=Flavobacterium psychrophilum TaxID=96345 RepID=A0A7U2RC27_FLAPS|nr:type ISP restriction/modification enzyme [Flavobacterium psychrophilum]AIG30715.1 helicase [Flavobacterium psychrophilum]AIG32990.1 helicase [Flavobacterium psychrophilum]AIG35145.1 helicase [Flavobacterium psychrophilum]AIG37510.1 helicase [Flavobacterium psychrophilum]AIG39774.1 helicase [Flavobacterium psychrophilum]
MSKSFNIILEKYRKISFSERDKGDRFERLIQEYLLTEPLYANRLKKVWMWNDFPAKNDLGGKDTGIDLVALTYDGDYWAIQCKCYQETSTIDKPAVDSFLATAGRSFKDENQNFKLTHFSNCLWVSTTNKWGTNAEEAIKNQKPPVQRISLTDLQNASVDWEKLENGIHGEQARTNLKSIRKHQKEAMDKTHLHFTTSDRGKLIMACGTGKTYTALQIAENETNANGFILFLVPSIALLGQTLREWCNDAKNPINAICICSDPEISKKKTKIEDSESFNTIDLALPASTNVPQILSQFASLELNAKEGMTVVFSTYQSIEVIAKAQQQLEKQKSKFAQFDLIICDEAHRTTGVTIAGEDESAFTKVHNNDFLKAKKRLYMTATPRLYDQDTKSKAAQAEAILCSMDEPELYGEEIYRIGFGEAVDLQLLTDYKVLILTLNEADVPPDIQKMIADDDHEIDLDDASKLIGCINALSKQILGDAGFILSSDPEPMKRAVAFCQSIKVSKKITNTFNTTSDAYINSLPQEKKSKMVSMASEHIDGTMSAPRRDELLSWLKEETPQNACRVLTNVRCLSEGVDVPSLDAVLFLSARNSQVDVVQSVGRVMRRAEGKKYGYIIIPVIVPSDIEADKALDDNKRYAVVWTVLNALRAHDDRFNATVNKIELNKKRPEQIIVGGAEYAFDADGNPLRKDFDPSNSTGNEFAEQLAIQFEHLQNVVFAKMVTKVGDKRYWEQWAKNVAEIAERQIIRINKLITEDKKHQQTFANFLAGLQKNINPSITQQESVEMLSQHIITKPVFDALFSGYSFVQNNPISVSMQTMLDLLEEKTIDEDAQTLNKFYESVKMRAADIDNAEGKQRIIIELYDKFFKTAFPKMVEKLGIVYTPVECVDFIIHSVNDILQKEFNRSLSDENIHILDPFTGTGTFITRLLQSGLISKEDLLRKYQNEIHANEIVLLAYYIAAVNIENAFHDAIENKDYIPFDGICLTDTFQLGETDHADKLFTEMFPQNSERVSKQKKAPLRIIIGNPPYSIGQKSANDNAQNQTYTKLDSDIAKTYAKESNAGLNKSLYDAYIKAFRWSSDRLDKNGGIICFISNGAWLDGNSTDGFRKSLEKEFTSIYVFNLRGNARTSGELRQKESGNVFGGGSRTPISITLLVKNPEKQNTKATIHYHDIGDYLSQNDKLKLIKNFKTVSNLPFVELQPNKEGDWINERNESFDSFIPLAPEKKFDLKTQTFFNTYTLGTATNRDHWVYNFSLSFLKENIQKTVNHYNDERKRLLGKGITNLEKNPEKGNWTRDWLNAIVKNKEFIVNNSEFRKTLYRPFCSTNSYFDDDLNQERYQLTKVFPNNDLENLVIDVTGLGVNKDFTVLITDKIPDLQTLSNGQCFPLYYYEERQKQTQSLFDTADSGTSEFVRRDAISDFILDQAKERYGKNVTKEDIFYYVYGLLHSPTYREMFANDLKKMLPRLPLLDDVRDFWKFSKAGRELAELHINYENQPKPAGVIVIHNPLTITETLKQLSADEIKYIDYKVEKMKFPKKDQKETIFYNSRITIDNIPAKAYQYVVNGKPAIEWIMERYAITTHKESQITNNPNDWSAETGNPKYILDLLLSVINVSLQTVDIVEGLPIVKF